MSLVDIAASALFVLCWLGYEPILKTVSGAGGGINHDMAVVRETWIRRMLKRDMRLLDANLLNHLLTSASFFASTNLIVIAAAASALFGGESMLRNLSSLAFAAPGPSWLIEAKIGLVVVTLSRGLLDFIWAIRQMNYCSALFGAAPEADQVEHHAAFARAMTNVLHPAFSSFNKGVRAYYFAMAAAAWLVSGWAMIAGVVAAMFWLIRRQVASQAAGGIREARLLFDAETKR
ncbi:MAG: DUF599 family protein [Pseudomonadota bacterium]